MSVNSLVLLIILWIMFTAANPRQNPLQLPSSLDLDNVWVLDVEKLESLLSGQSSSGMFSLGSESPVHLYTLVHCPCTLFCTLFLYKVTLQIKEIFNLSSSSFYLDWGLKNVRIRFYLGNAEIFFFLQNARAFNRVN